MVSYTVIGQHIHKARVRLGWTQAEVADRIGISTAYYGKIERGVIKPNIDRLAEISQALRIPCDSLFKGAFIPDAEPMDNLPVSSEEFSEYMNALSDRVSPRTKEIIMRICAELSGLDQSDE